MSLNPVHGEMYSLQHYVMKFVSDLRQVTGFLQFPPPIKLTATIWLKDCGKWQIRQVPLHMTFKPCTTFWLEIIAADQWVFSGYSGFLHQYNWPTRCNWNIVESGIKHNYPTWLQIIQENKLSELVIVWFYFYGDFMFSNHFSIVILLYYR